LENHLNDPNIRIIEVDISPEPYKNAHIPGTVFWNIFTDLLLPDWKINLDVQAFEKLMARSGITNDMTVIAYGNNPATGAWIFWLLKVFGHENVRVINGGYQKWKSEGRPLATELSTFGFTDYSAKSPDASLRVLHNEIQASINRGDWRSLSDSLRGEAIGYRVLLDVRTVQEYCGEWFFNQPPKEGELTGHIPGAVHLEHILTLNEDGTFKSFNELKNLYISKGITADKEVFPYCTIGARSGYIWFVLKYLLGYPNVRNYDGSWNEWSRLPDVAIER
jgi:thiosulfate/3-mercaptopyruvate sulfurtransferase